MHPVSKFLSRLLKPLISLMAAAYRLLVYITPSRLQRRLHNLISVCRQIVNFIFGRALPDLLPHIPNVDLSGRTAIVTGANSGIGQQIALELTRRGASVVLACRSTSRGEAALNQILWNVPHAKGRMSVLKLDTSSLESVREFALKWVEVQSAFSGRKRLDILVHNAGISHAPPNQDTTDEGIDTVYATNFLGSFLLTYLLEPHLSSDARVIFTSSIAQLGARFKDDFSPGSVRGLCEPGFHAPSSNVPLLGWELVDTRQSARYGMTKAMQCAMAKLLQRRWDEESVETGKVDAEVSVYEMDGYGRTKATVRKRTAHSFTPGFTMTPVFSKFEDSSWITAFLRDPTFTILRLTTVLATDVEQGAATGAWLACTQDPEVANGGGGHWERMRREFSVADEMSKDLLVKLWKRWERDAGVEWALPLSQNQPSSSISDLARRAKL